MQNLVELGSVVQGKKQLDNVKKFTITTTTTTTDNGKISISKAHLAFSSGELHVIKKNRKARIDIHI